MAAWSEEKRKRQDVPGSKVRKLLSHPWRVRILEVLDNYEMSCSQIVDYGLIPELASRPRNDAISMLAYHFRVLLKGGLIEVVKSVQRGGSYEQICRANEGAHHTTEEWARLTREERSAITPMTLSSLIALVDNALLSDTFDNRVDRHLSYLPMELDEQGWADLGPVLDGVLDIVLRVRGEAKERLEESGEMPIRATWGQMFFESPSIPAALDPGPPLQP
jgi:DNA-binding transcriptional ArsR family regulator